LIFSKKSSFLSTLAMASFTKMCTSNVQKYYTYCQASFIRTLKNQNSYYPTQNWQEQISPTPNAFHLLIWKPRCLIPRQKFRDRYVKSIEKNAKPDYTKCFLVVLSNHNGSVKVNFQHTMNVSGRTCRVQLGLLYTSFSHLISF